MNSIKQMTSRWLVGEPKLSTAAYLFEKRVGQGHSAKVYRAVRVDSLGHSRQVVALKILKSWNSVSWLKREFETLTQVNSRHCARVLGWENLKEGPTLVLEWIDGLTLFDFHRLGRLKALHEEIGGITQEIVAQIYCGLSDLDAHGLHHGDLSPSNIMIDRNGLVRLIDFASPPQERGCFLGTPAYTAPEIWNGASTSHSSDLFSLGVIEHEISFGLGMQTNTQQEARARVEFLSHEGAGLLARNPAERSKDFVESSPELRAALARSVGGCLLKENIKRGVTALISVPNYKQPRPFRLRGVKAVVACMSLFTITAAVRAEAPLMERGLASSLLRISSQQWIHFKINGRDAGYSPLEIRQLTPGYHRVVWKTRHAQGEFRVHLEPGDEKRITESDLQWLLSKKGSFKKLNGSSQPR